MYRSGDFVVCNFPFEEASDSPGPAKHIGLCLGTMEARGRRIAVVAAYTTSQPWPNDVVLPKGVHRIGEARAVLMGHKKAFIIDARKIAFIPLEEEFFPQLGGSHGGKIGESKQMARVVLQDLATLDKTPGVVVRVGPLRPR
jgi:hypothetical protein